MATKKDLVEAYSFSRRRLVTAFVSGAPGGREVEPSRPGRTIVGGIALAVLMIAGAAVLGILTDRDPGDWQQVGLVSEKETSADYVILTEDGPLRPISNITSAMLLLGADVEATEVSRDVIAKEGRRGEPIGILQAPETPPVPEDLLPTGWTACTSGDDATQLGVKVTISESPDVTPTPDAGLVVRSGGRFFLIAETVPEDGRGEPRGYFHEVTKRNADAVLRSVVPTSKDDAVPVPREWLELFTPGAPLTLDALGLDPTRLGKEPREATPNAPKARVGDLLTVGDATYLVTDEGSAIELDPFALGVYLGLDKPRSFSPEEIEASSPPGTIEDTGNLGTNWPVTKLQEGAAGDYCAQLDAVVEGDPGARIVSATEGEESAAEVPPGSIERFVESGRGAVVRVGDWDVEGDAPAVLVDDRGFVYPLIGTAVSQLGYGSVDDVVVPDTWTALFPPGVELSVDAARCPPTTSPRTGPCAS